MQKWMKHVGFFTCWNFSSCPPLDRPGIFLHVSQVIKCLRDLFLSSWRISLLFERVSSCMRVCLSRVIRKCGSVVLHTYAGSEVSLHTLPAAGVCFSLSHTLQTALLLFCWTCSWEVNENVFSNSTAQSFLGTSWRFKNQASLCLLNQQRVFGDKSVEVLFQLWAGWKKILRILIWWHNWR